jgi:hypothetical protein
VKLYDEYSLFLPTPPISYAVLPAVVNFPLLYQRKEALPSGAPKNNKY